MGKVKENSWKNPIGYWHVTTDADEHGRGVRHIGTFYGHYINIALALADKACYALHFQRINEDDMKLPNLQTANKIQICFEDGLGVKSRQIVADVSELDQTEGASISACTWDGYITICRQETEDMKKNKAIEKCRKILTQEEFDLLGL